MEVDAAPQSGDLPREGRKRATMCIGSVARLWLSRG